MAGAGLIASAQLWLSTMPAESGFLVVLTALLMNTV